MARTRCEGGPIAEPFLQKSGLGLGKITDVNANLDVVSCQHLAYCPEGQLPPKVPVLSAVRLCCVQIYLFAFRMVQA